jgi:hypothetical protein
MSIESQLREKLRKIEALFAGAGTAGERLAAEVALQRVRERLTELGRQDLSIEMQFLDAGSTVTPSVSRLVPALRHEALSLLSAAAQHGHGSRTQTVPRSSSVAGVLRA